MSSCQQGELYRAEERALARLARAPAASRVSLEEAQRLMDSWRELPWWGTNFPNVRYVEVRAKPPAAVAAGDGSVGDLLAEQRAAICEMSPTHMVPLFLAHEVSHPLTTSRYGRNGHGPWFARTYLQIVCVALGSGAYEVLWEELEAAGIDHRIDE